MDINSDAPRRRRHSRTKRAMVNYADTILEIAERLLLEVDAKIGKG
jgi:hypothetical protein